MPNDLLPEALADALGQVVADLRREWQLELRAITGEAQAAVAEMKLAAAAETGALARLEQRIEALEARSASNPPLKAVR